MSFENFLDTLKVNSEEEYKKMYDKIENGTPAPLKAGIIAPDILDFSLNYSLELIKKYHQWLIENYDITPKH